jgi:hypothetical protein
MPNFALPSFRFLVPYLLHLRIGEVSGRIRPLM